MCEPGRGPDTGWRRNADSLLRGWLPRRRPRSHARRLVARHPERNAHHPGWKISLDIEPASWDDLRREDPQAYREFRKLLERSGGERPRRNRERHIFAALRLGARRRKQYSPAAARPRNHPPAFPERGHRNLCRAGAVLVELPAATAALAGLHRRRPEEPRHRVGRLLPPASTPKSSTGWGPTAHPSPPCRATPARNVRTWETESVTGSAEFSRKCVAHGIAHPAGNCFQDLGWARATQGHRRHIRFVTWREYMRRCRSNRRSSGASAPKIS